MEDGGRTCRKQYSGYAGSGVVVVVVGWKRLVGLAEPPMVQLGLRVRKRLGKVHANDKSTAPADNPGRGLGKALLYSHRHSPRPLQRYLPP